MRAAPLHRVDEEPRARVEAEVRLVGAGDAGDVELRPVEPVGRGGEPLVDQGGLEASGRVLFVGVENGHLDRDAGRAHRAPVQAVGALPDVRLDAQDPEQVSLPDRVPDRRGANLEDPRRVRTRKTAPRFSGRCIVVRTFSRRATPWSSRKSWRTPGRTSNAVSAPRPCDPCTSTRMPARADVRRFMGCLVLKLAPAGPCLAEAADLKGLGADMRAPPAGRAHSSCVDRK